MEERELKFLERFLCHDLLKTPDLIRLSAQLSSFIASNALLPLKSLPLYSRFIEKI